MAVKKRIVEDKPIVKKSISIELSTSDTWTDAMTVAHVVEWLKEVEANGIPHTAELSYDSFLRVNSGEPDGD